MAAPCLGPLPDHGRFGYRPITRRAAYRWPGGTGLALYIGFNLEHFAFGEGLGAAIGPPSPAPDVLNHSWREYGNRVGAWRCLELFDQLGLPTAALINTALYDHCPELIEQLEAAPRADAVAVFAPAVVEHVRRWRRRADRRAEPLAEREVLEVEPDVQRQPRTAGPTVRRPPRDRPVAEAAMVGQRPQVRCGHRGLHDVASPARTSSHSALSFHTSICAMRPCRTT